MALMKNLIFWYSLLLSLSSWANDDCFNAVSLATFQMICDAPTTSIVFGPNTPSSTPPNTCIGLNVPDFWLHLNVPVGNTNSYMIRRRAGTTIAARAEVLYKFGCSPGNNCCEFGMSLIGCYSFDEFPNAIVLQNPAPGDYYVRIWDALFSPVGTFVTSAHTLSPNINDWIICDDISGEGSGFRANQLIVQPGDMFDPSIYNPAFAIIDSCPCSDPPLLLFQANDFEIFTDGKITAQNDPEVEGSGNNYKMEVRRIPFMDHCSVIGTCTALNKYVPGQTTSLSRIAIIDSGVNTGHEAFSNAHWVNDDPLNPEACVQVSNIGYDFKYDQLVPEDSLGHGSWVAGTVIEDFPTDIQLELMSLKFFGGNDDFLFDAVCAIHYAISQGASTIVTSWGFTSAEYPSILDDALTTALFEDVLVVASAGNLGNDNDDPIIGKYPANAPLDNIISVTAFDELMQNVPEYANYGAINVDLASVDHVIAPGATPNGMMLTDRDSVVGTSISAPRVARTAAILKAYYPILDAREIRSCILSSVELKPALVSVVATSGVLNHKGSMQCATSAAMQKACQSNSITVVGTLINDVAYKTSAYLRSSAIIESTADVLMQAAEQILLKTGFEVRLGAEFQADNTDCSVIGGFIKE